MRLYSIQDHKSKTFHSPFTAQTDNEAQRVFSEITNDSRTLLNKYPADFTLHHLGEFDPDDGELFPEPVKQIASALDHINTKSNDDAKS